MSVPAYESYKDSGVEWLGRVPSHWDCRPLKHLVTMRSGGTPSKEREDYWGGEIPWASAKDLKVDTLIDTQDHVTAEALDEGAAQLLPANAVVVLVRGMMLARTFPVCRLSRPMTINQDLKGLLPNLGVDPNYLAWSLRASEVETLCRLDEAGHGTKALRMDAWATMQMPAPSLLEQRTIAAFLDRETAKIDALVEAQERLIALLKEKRQAVISHAVTKGLDPSAPTKDSGIEWLGQVPAHWELLKLGRITTASCDGPFGSGLKSEHYVDEGVRVVRLQNIKDGSFDGTDAAFIDATYFEAELTRHNVLADDVLIAGLGDERNLVGRACVAPASIEPAMVKADCFRFRISADIADPRFIAIQLSAGASFDAGKLSTGSTRSRIPLSTMATRPVALPPLAEQRAIAAYVASRTAAFDEMRSRAEAAITLLKERRAALISAAVTGKIDVRGLVQTAEAA